jgi:hypothetical protein
MKRQENGVKTDIKDMDKRDCGLGQGAAVGSSPSEYGNGIWEPIKDGGFLRPADRPLAQEGLYPTHPPTLFLSVNLRFYRFIYLYNTIRFLCKETRWTLKKQIDYIFTLMFFKLC